MDLVERYIEAVKFWLPKATRDDIAAELREDIRSEIEEAEREKGRKLTEDEISALLKARGTPLSVASRYLPHRSLIGPELFPFYILALRIVAVICVILVAIAVFLRFLGFDMPGPGPFGESVGHPPAVKLLVAFAIITIVFAFIEWKGINPLKTMNWNPRSLRHAQPPVNRTYATFDIAANLAVLILFMLGYLSQTSYSWPGGSITFCPEWILFWQISAAIGVVEIVFSSVNLLRPTWTVPRVIVRVAIDLAKLGAFIWLMQHDLVRAGALPYQVTSRIPSAIIHLVLEHSEMIGAAALAVIAILALDRLRRIVRQHAQLSVAA